MKYSDLPSYTRPANYRATQPWRLLLNTLSGYLKDKPGLIMNPDFQRAHVWTRGQQIAYVEYILRGGTTGKDILFNCPGWMSDFEGPFVLVDGKQRLKAVTLFLRNRIPAFGYKYQEFEGMLPHECSFTFFVNNLKTRQEVLQWYLEINTTGTPHTVEEIDKVKRMLQESKHNEY